MNKKVLVVEDNDLNRKLFTSLLQERGFDVIEAVDGEEAIAKIESESPAVILLDIMLPKVDGFEVFRTCRKRGILGNAQVYALTASALSEVSEAGFDGVISKPVKVKEFLSVVTGLMEGKGTKD